MSSVALSVGNFDGVHLGHAALIDRARRAVGTDGRVVVMAFDPHPRSALAKGNTPARLTAFEHRRELLLDLGADEVEQLVPNEELLGRTPEAFVDACLRRHDVAAFVEGTDFCFGKGRAGDVRTLARIGEARGYDTHVVDPVEVALTNQCVVTASSSFTRWLLERGRIEDAALLLGRPYEIRGECVRGDRRGRSIGFPTANVRTPQMLPADGVYAARADIEGLATDIPAAVHVGPRGTFDAPERTMEAHLIRWSPPEGTEAYARAVRLRLTRWVRSNVRFESVNHLTDQLARDVERCAALEAHTTGANA